MSESEFELTGVALLADRPVDRRRVALVMALFGLGLSFGGAGMLVHLLESMSVEPPRASMVRAHGADGPVSGDLQRRVAVVLIDGLRVDEAEGMSSWRAIEARSVTGEIELVAPTLSRPFYHYAFTGAPPDVSGVRSNGFADHARFDSVFDRTRAAGGSVFIVADQLDWFRRMHGAGVDRIEDHAGALRGPLDEQIAEWRVADAPALLLVHATQGDATAHRGGIGSPEHLAQNDVADDVVARVTAVHDAVVFVMSDHGHLEAGGHGGLELEVARAPLLVVGPELEPARLPDPVPLSTLAATFSAQLGVSRPRASESRVVAELAPRGYSRDERWDARAAVWREAVRRDAESSLRLRREWALALAFFFALMTLGPIKRAFELDRSVLVAWIAWPTVVLGVHILFFGRPLSLSAIDEKISHGIRVALLGLLAFVVAYAISRASARVGDKRAKMCRSAASVAWIASVLAVVSCAWAGFAFGPWPLGPTELYLPLLALGTAGPSLLAAAVVLIWSRREHFELLEPRGAE